MALVVYNNIYSVTAQNKLAIANSALQRSIERLSSGLRINHASDDASGLAVSEKLRSQIRGLAKASMNAQDATSFLQTAEGGLEVIGDILQRMRELAVQAGNGTYTSNDRKELQKEVDQLKSEVNRIASSTEYNTKKLLTGQSAALWSTSNPSAIAAIVRGTPAEGNYAIDIQSLGGKNYVYKSDIFTDNSSLTRNAYEYEFTLGGSAESATFANVKGEITGKHTILGTDSRGSEIASATYTYLQTRGMLANGLESKLSGKLTAASADGTYYVLEVIKDGDLATIASQADKGAVSYFKMYTINIASGEIDELVVQAANLSNDVAGFDIGTSTGTTITLEYNTRWAVGDKIVYYAQGNITSTDATMRLDGNGPAYSTGASGSFAIVELDVNGDISVGRGEIDRMASPTAPVEVTLKPTMKSMTLLKVDEGSTTGVKINSAKSYVVGGYYPTGLNVKLQDGGYTAEATWVDGKSIKDITTNVVLNTAAFTDEGSLLIELINDITQLSSATSADFKVTFIDANTGLESSVDVGITGQGTGAFNLVLSGQATGIDIDFSNGALTAGDKILLKGHLATISTGTIAIVTGDFAIEAAKGENIIYNVQMDTGGNVMKSQVRVYLNSTSSLDLGTISFKAPQQVADLNTKLRDVPLFTNADGRMILDNAQELTLFGNGKTASLFVEGSDTIKDLRDKLNKAILELGMGTGISAIDNNLVHYVTEKEAQSGFNAVAGTFVFQGAMMGANSAIELIGDQGLIDALSVAQLQAGTDSEVKVTVRDAHNNALIGEDIVGDNTIRNIIKGIDVKILNPPVTVSYDSRSGVMRFGSTPGDKPVMLHVADARTAVQIGANEGQTFDVSLAEMSTRALEIDDAYVTTMAASQKAITKFGQALEKVVSARATIGAQINRLEYTIRNLSVSRENLIASESRIRDLDVAAESADFARNQILVNGAVAMLAQANTLPQLALQLIGR